MARKECRYQVGVHHKVSVTCQGRRVSRRALATGQMSRRQPVTLSATIAGESFEWTSLSTVVEHLVLPDVRAEALTALPLSPKSPDHAIDTFLLVHSVTNAQGVPPNMAGIERIFSSGVFADHASETVKLGAALEQCGVDPTTAWSQALKVGITSAIQYTGVVPPKRQVGGRDLYRAAQDAMRRRSDSLNQNEQAGTAELYGLETKAEKLLAAHTALLDRDSGRPLWSRDEGYAALHADDVLNRFAHNTNAISDPVARAEYARLCDRMIEVGARVTSVREQQEHNQQVEYQAKGVVSDSMQQLSGVQQDSLAWN